MPALDHKEFKDLYPLKVIKSRKDYEKALKSMETVFDETNGPLAEYAETLTILIEHCEEEHYPIEEATGNKGSLLGLDSTTFELFTRPFLICVF